MPAEARLRFYPTSGDAGLDVAATAGAAALGIVLPLVGVPFRRPVARPAGPPSLQRRIRVEQSLELHAVVDVRPGQVERERDALGVDHQMAFAACLALIRWVRAEDVAPPFAATLERSSDRRLQSISSAHARCRSRT